MITSKLYVHKVLNGLSLSQLRQLAGEFKMDSRGSKSQLIYRLINPVQIGGAGPTDYWIIGGQLEALLLNHIDSYTGELSIPIEQIENVLDEAKIKYIYSPKEWFKILLPSKILSKHEPPFDALPVFVNSLNVLPELSYGELKLLNSYYPKTLNIDQQTLEAKKQSDLAELRTWLASYSQNYSIGALSNLNSLFIHGTQLKTLPDSIGALSNLKGLYLSGTQLRSLPDSIGALSKLETIYLRNTPLRSLPNSIRDLSNLRSLNLSETQLESLPDLIGALSNLERLYLTGTPLESLPDSIGALSNLKYLWLSGTPLESLPDSIGNLSNLEDIYLRGTQLQSLPVVQRLRDRGVRVII